MRTWARAWLQGGLVALVALASAASGAGTAAPPSAAAATFTAAPDSYAPGVVHVKFKRSVAATSAKVSRYRAQATRELAPGLGAMALPVAPGTEVDVIRELRADPSVEYAEPNYYLTIAAAFPTDPAFYNQDKIDPTNREDVLYRDIDNMQRQYVFRLPQIAEAWDLANGTSDMIIATIDTGAYLKHPDLEGRLMPAANFVAGEEGVKNEEDYNGHGTAVAGILVANRNNGKFLAGINGRAKVLPIKAFNDQGSTTVEPIIKAVKFAADNGAKVVNMSLSYTKTPVEPDRVAALQDAIVAYLYSRGITVVGAMGNFGQTERSTDPFPPANFDSVIAVGATNYQLTDPDGKPIDNPRELLSPISNRGPWVSVVAPGQNIRVLTGFESPDCGQKDDNGKDKGFFCGQTGDTWRSGSSFATPIVTGVASLIMGCHPQMTPAQVRTVIQGSADKIGDGGASGYSDGGKGRNDFYGYGRVNAFKAVQLANTMTRVAATTVRSAATTKVFIPLGLRNADGQGNVGLGQSAC
jgi:thermitase